MRGVGMKGAAVMVAATAILVAGPALGADKSSYTLFNPTPDRLLRDMTTDRPDVTESPFTVDAGHIQIESNLFGYGAPGPTRRGPSRTATTSPGPTCASGSHRPWS